jgi:preprotein translocase subunit YajC
VPDEGIGAIEAEAVGRRGRQALQRFGDAEKKGVVQACHGRAFGPNVAPRPAPGPQAALDAPGHAARFRPNTNLTEPSPMFISPAYAQDAAGAGAMVMQLAPLILIFVVFYFLLIRPQQTKMKEHRAMLSELKRGDKVITAGGIVAEIKLVTEGKDEIEAEIAPNVRVKLVRGTIASVIKPQAANDAKA